MSACPGGLDCVDLQLCPGGQNVNFTCGPGYVCPGYQPYYSPNNPFYTAPIYRCLEKFYCPSPTSGMFVCPQGYYCPEGFAQPVKCHEHAHCPAGSKHQVDIIGPASVLVSLLLAVAIACGIRKIVDVRKKNTMFSKDGKFRQNKAKAGSSTESSSLLRGSSSFASPNSSLAADSIVIENLNCSVRCGGSSRRAATTMHSSPSPSPSPSFSEVALLKSCSAVFKPMSLTAIMGPSGAGKSTLIRLIMGDVIADEHGNPASVSGTLSLGNLRDGGSGIGLVPQQDACLSMLTVRETLEHAVTVKCPELSKNSRQARVLHALRILRLEHVANSYVGSPVLNYRGLSGGERKRVCIGVELVAWPAVLILDEPTTGLDSQSAMVVMDILKLLTVQANKTVIVVVHQPRQEIFDTFDSVLLLARGGKSVFQGSPTDAIAFSERLGGALPAHMNSADFVLESISLHGDNIRSPTPRVCNPEPTLALSHPRRVSQASAVVDDCAHHHSNEPRTCSCIRVFLRLLLAFSVRELKQRLRSYRSIALASFMHVAMGCILGGAFSTIRGVTIYKPQIFPPEAIRCPLLIRNRCANEPVDQSVLEDMIFITLMILHSCGTIAAQFSFAEERRLWKQELCVAGGSRSSRFGSVLSIQTRKVTFSPYLTAKFLIDLPFLVYFGVLFMYSFTMILSPFGNYEWYVAIGILTSFSAYGTGYLVSFCSSEANSLLNGVVVSLLAGLTTGTHPRLSDVSENQFLKMVWWLSPLRWIGELWYIKEAGAYADHGFEVDGGFRMMGFQQRNTGMCIAMVILLGCAFRCVSYIVFWTLFQSVRLMRPFQRTAAQEMATVRQK
eukprot:ANDGO_01017.mRNA.1 putative ABC transporter ATP-binding protein/permease YOL075C